MPRATTRRSGGIVETPLGHGRDRHRHQAARLHPPTRRATRSNLAYADIIVAGGTRAADAPDNFKLVWELAEVLGAEVGATRAVVQAGWVRDRAPGRPDRQDGAAQALHRRRHLRRDPAPRRAWKART
ncbi:MAG: FAD-binding protein [Rhodopseudomonas palustris]|nr:FAD-binding protein [Rhodopseudomonas palustris]